MGNLGQSAVVWFMEQKIADPQQRLRSKKRDAPWKSRKAALKYYFDFLKERMKVEGRH